MRDPVELEVFKNLYHSIAEEMGAALRRTSFSPNIKERRDYSCAVFDTVGQVIAMGDHMPVHLGSMPMSVAAAVEQGELEAGDVVMLNDPFRGGTHLPDITLVMPVYISAAKKSRPTTPDFYVASRAHHADVGGTYPGSMGPCREIYQEGLRIPPVKIMRNGKLVADVLALLLNNVRTPEEREGDLGAQIAACQTGAQRLRETCDGYGIVRAKKAAADLLLYSEEMMRAFLHTIPPGRYQAEDFLDSEPTLTVLHPGYGLPHPDFKAECAHTRGEHLLIDPAPSPLGLHVPHQQVSIGGSHRPIMHPHVAQRHMKLAARATR